MKTITVKFENLLDGQEKALLALFRCFQQLGQLGCSREVRFYADGDGSFHPRVTVVDGDVISDEDYSFALGSSTVDGSPKIDCDVLLKSGS